MRIEKVFCYMRPAAMRIAILIILTLTTISYSYSQSEGVTGVIIINENSSVTNSPEKKVDLSIKAQGAVAMMLSNNGSYLGAKWETYQSRKTNWRLEGGDGIKTIYAKFKDRDGNVSETVTATIELDTSPPAHPEILINGGVPHTNNRSRTVMLELQAEGADKMRISNRADFLSAPWLPYRDIIKGWKLDQREGNKTVYVQFKDNAGNYSPVVSADILLDLRPPVNCKVLVNDHQRFTNTRTVKLKMYADGATEMIIRGGEGWVPFQEEIEWELPPGDGRKDVFVKFRDAVGNQSVVVSDNIYLDSKGPGHGMMVINNGSRYTRRYDDVHLKLLATGAKEMMLSNDSTFKGAQWQPYMQHIPSWLLPDEDGRHTVYARFRDEAGNVSRTCKDKIILDKTAPVNPFIRMVSKESVYDSLNNIAVIKNESKIVDLQISCKGADYMMISNISSFYGAKWERYRPKIENWELGGTNDGDRSVFVKFRDRAGNESEVAYDRAEIDTQPPVDCRLTIDNNAEYCTDPDKKVQLQLFARGADYMMISEDPTFEGAEWQPYEKIAAFQLGGDDGIKTVVARFKDFAGNVSEHVVDDIIMDRRPPFDCSLELDKDREVTRHPDKVVLASVKAKDAVLMQIAHSADFKNARWQGFTNLNFSWILAGDDGEKTVYARFKDKAGNISEAVTDDITLDRTPPREGTVVINEGENITNNANKVVKLSLHAEEAVEMRLANRFDFKQADGSEASWIPFEKETEWRLVGPDGVKYVYVQFRDAIGNVSKTAYARIGIDRSAPREGRISINRNSKFCTDVSGYVDLQLYAIEATHMMLSNNQGFESAEWLKYESYYQNWILDTQEDGVKKVYAKFKDIAGNETTPIVASITLDRQEPVAADLKINNGAAYTNDQSMLVDLGINAEGATEMMISNSQHFRGAHWEPYTTEKKWGLRGTDGTKVVWIKFRDEARNESDPVSASILLDTQAPIPQYVKINGGKTLTESSRVTLTIKARDADFMMVSNDPRFEAAFWEPYTATKEWDLKEGEGLKRIFVKFKDSSENESANKFADITLVPKF